MKSFEIAALAFQRDQQQLAAIGQNVANASSVAYRRQVPLPGAFEGQWLSAGGLSVDGGVAVVAGGLQGGGHLAIDSSSGKLSLTARALDVALGARDYLQVAHADGTTAFSRGGSLMVDAERRLASSEGFRVLDAKGAEVTLPPQAQRIEIDAAGRVLADGQALATLGVVRAQPDTQFRSMGNGLLELASGARPQAVDNPEVHPGALEASNVVPSQEMVHLMATTRHAEALARIVQGSDELLEKAIRKFGELS